jgi:hypothetical protein
MLVRCAGVGPGAVKRAAEVRVAMAVSNSIKYSYMGYDSTPMAPAEPLKIKGRRQSV